MIDMARRFFGKVTKSGAGSQRGEGATTHDIRVASCALLVEMTKIDGEFSDSEEEKLIFLLERDFGLSKTHAKELIDAARHELEGSIDLWRFTNLINQNYSLEEKIQVVETIWKVAYADGNLDKHEDYLVHKLAKLLRLTHKQLIEAKMRATKAHLSGRESAMNRR